jgi:hypothetical protein
MLVISKEGNLVLLTNNNQTLVWSTNITTKSLSNNTSSHVAQLLDNGNFVIKDNNNSDPQSNNNFLWQGFDFPCDTLLPEMKLGWDLKTGLNRQLTSWKNWDDPSSGDLSWGIVLSSNPEVVMKKGSTEIHRSGPWNGVGFSGAPVEVITSTVVVTKSINNSDEVYYTYSLVNTSVVSITYLNQTVDLRRRIAWSPEEDTWKVYESVPTDYCDEYNHCGSYGNCVHNESLSTCLCLNGFEPKSSQNWNTFNSTQGCVRKGEDTCGVNDSFQRFYGLKLPETKHTWVDANMTLDDCKNKCLADCSCTAYSNLDVGGDGSGCCIWFGDLIDLKQISSFQQYLYIRTDDSTVGKCYVLF